MGLFGMAFWSWLLPNRSKTLDVLVHDRMAALGFASARLLGCGSSYGRTHWSSHQSW